MTSERLEEAGLKKTKPRVLVLEALKKEKYPISAEKLYLLLAKKGIHLSTVYRTLNSFVEKGIAKKEVDENKENVYSLLADEDSHVLVCVRCHKRIPLEGCPYKEANDRLESETGYKILDHNIEILGLCPDCQKKEKERIKGS